MIFKNINIKYIKHILAFSIPLIPHTIGAMLIGFLSRIIIGKVLTNSDLGVFNVSAVDTYIDKPSAVCYYCCSPVIESTGWPTIHTGTRA
jgi:hypothetical protein